MSQWLINYWWLVWALAAVGGLVAFRMHRRGGDEPVLRRVMDALFPRSDPANRSQRHLSARSVILLGGGLVLVMFVYLVLLQSRYWDVIAYDGRVNRARPNPARNRTGRHAARFLSPSARPAGQLDVLDVIPLTLHRQFSS